MEKNTKKSGFYNSPFKKHDSSSSKGLGKLPSGNKQNTQPAHQNKGSYTWSNDPRIDEYYAKERRLSWLDKEGNRIIPDYSEVVEQDSCDVEYNPYSSSKAGKHEYRPLLKDLEPPMKRRGGSSPADFYLGKTSDFISKMSDEELATGLSKLQNVIEHGRSVSRSTKDMETEYCWHQFESSLRTRRVSHHNQMVPELRRQIRELFGDNE